MSDTASGRNESTKGVNKLATATKATALESRISRDQLNAEVAAAAARAELAKLRPTLAPMDSLRGITDFDRSRIDYEDRREAALDAISADPFQAMVEVSTEIA